jgi:hypothetical protein
VGPVVTFGGEQEDTEFGAVHASGGGRVDGWTCGRRTYWAGFDGVRPSMCANR